jgi:transcriptional regulator with XRE-family HTH domain
MSMNSIREQLVRKLEDKEYRDAFVSEQIFSGLPLKIRSLREQRRLSQKQLGEKTSVAQAWVSKLEDPNYGKLTLSTLLRLASAFDVGLEVDFVPFSKVLDNALGRSKGSFKVGSFEQDHGLGRGSAHQNSGKLFQVFVGKASADETYLAGGASRTLGVCQHEAA